MELSCEGSMLSADIKRGSERMCRVSIAAEGLSDEDQRTALTEKARMWIVDYLSRPHTGQTHFGDLAE